MNDSDKVIKLLEKPINNKEYMACAEREND